MSFSIFLVSLLCTPVSMSNPVDVAHCELTGDGVDEVCILLQGSPGTLLIMAASDQQGMVPVGTFPTGNGPIDIAFGDFYGNGRTDIAVANTNSNAITIYFNDDNNLANRFVTQALQVDGPPTCIAGVNANRDGISDLAVGLQDTDGDGDGKWVIYLGTVPLRSMLGGMVEGGEIPAVGVPLGLDPSLEEDQKDGYVFNGATDTGMIDVVRSSFNQDGSMHFDAISYNA
jgi:hypothetical protein